MKNKRRRRKWEKLLRIENVFARGLFLHRRSQHLAVTPRRSIFGRSHHVAE